MPLRASHTSFMWTSETYMITVACPCSQPEKPLNYLYFRLTDKFRTRRSRGIVKA